MESRESQPEYLVIVPRDRRDLVDHLTQQFADDPRVRVVHDRRAGRLLPPEPGAQLRKAPDFGKVLRAADVVIICGQLQARIDEVSRANGTDADTGGQADVEKQDVTAVQFRPLIENTQHLLGALVRLLDEHDELKAEAQRVAEDRQNLRREIHDLQRENESLRSKGEVLWKEQQTLLEDRNALVKEREGLLNERERITAGLSKFMREVVQPMSTPTHDAGSSRV